MLLIFFFSELRGGILLRYNCQVLMNNISIMAAMHKSKFNLISFEDTPSKMVPNMMLRAAKFSVIAAQCSVLLAKSCVLINGDAEVQ